MANDAGKRTAKNKPAENHKNMTDDAAKQAPRMAGPLYTPC